MFLRQKGQVEAGNGLFRHEKSQANGKRKENCQRMKNRTPVGYSIVESFQFP